MRAHHHNRVYKITSSRPWQEAIECGNFTGSADDLRDGHIHLSAGHQLAATANKYFAGVEDLILVAFEAAALGAPLVWETSRGGDLFPHYYGALPVAAATWVRPLPLDDSGIPRVLETLDLETGAP
jgi:uncharacterized protein (DUF952 family)